MATQVQTTTRTQLNGAPRKPAAPRAAPVKKSATATAGKRAPPSSAHKPAAHTQNKAASVAGENPASGGGVTSAYAIMASRIANRVAEMAESITFVERPKPSEAEPEPVEQEKRRPRKLEMRLNNSAADSVAFSAPFLDNTLQKMLQLQNRMLKTTADLSKSEGVDEKMVKEHAAQSAELSRIIALICAEKARQGA